jgi:hypothetical protein
MRKMSDYRATAAQWERLEQRQLGGNDLVCAVLELRARVEALDKRCEVQLMQLSELQERHHRLTLQVGHLEHELVRDDDDEPQQYCLEALEPPDADAKPTSNPSQIRSSLVERVQAAIGHSYPDDARAAIREVASWMKEQGRYPDAWMAQRLQKEAEHG